MTARPEQIAEVIQDMEKQAEHIEQQIIDICYSMNGGIPWDDAWNSSHTTREKIVTAVNKRIRAANGDKREYM